MAKYKFSQRSIRIPDSGIGYISQYASKHKDVISLGQGTPLFPTPSFIYDELYKRSKTDKTLGMYSGPAIWNELKSLIVKQMKDLYGFTPEFNQLDLTIGGIGGLFAVFMALLEKGDEVIFFDPSYPLHLSQIHLTQAKAVFVPYNEKLKWKIDLDKFEKAITKKTRVVVLTNPNNPTGTVLSKDEVKELARIVLKHNLILVLDEAYDFLVYEKELFSPLRLPSLRKNIVVCKSFSKEFAMTGWRIGYVWADKEIMAKIHDIHLHFSVNAVTPSIAAAIAALKDNRGRKATEGFIQKFTESRKAICERLDRLPKLFSYYQPEGAYYTFPKYLHFKVDSFKFAEMLVDEAKVVTIPGSSAGPRGEEHIRMSFAADKSVIHRAFDRIDKLAKKHDLV
jgi:aminotransferase